VLYLSNLNKSLFCAVKLFSLVSSKMWQRLLIKKQITSIITSKSPKTCTKALFSTRKTDAATKPQNNQNSYTAFAESLNQHKITLNVQQSDVNSNFARTNSSGSKNNNNKYYRAESANLLEDLNKRYLNNALIVLIYTC
jgi:hypothetical protein